MPTINGRACVANGRNLIIQSDLKHGFLKSGTGGINGDSVVDFHSDNYIPTNGATVFTFSSPDYAFKGAGNHTLAMYDSDKNYLGWQSITSATQTLSKSNASYIRFSINSVDEGNTTDNLSDWLANHRYKLEKGSVATPLTPAPVDKVFSDGVQVYGRNYLANTGTPWQTQGSGGTNQNSGNKWLFTFGAIKQAPFKDGDYVTVSFDYTSIGTGAYGTINPQFNQTPWRLVNDGEAMKDTGHAVRTVQWQSGWTSGTANGIQIRMDNVATTRIVAVYNMQFERGNKATDWSPAPEDVM